MDRSVQYAQVMANFDSVYNVTPNVVHHSTIHVPTSSNPMYWNQSVSPSMTSSIPKFNFDLYNPNEYNSTPLDYRSPSSSVIVHHHPVYSPHPPPHSQAISKLRQINDELSQTLANCEITNHTQPLSPHYHIHHYPVSHETYRSRSPSEPDVSSSSSSSPEPQQIRQKRNARIKYKTRIPRRPSSLSTLDQIFIATSDAYSSKDPMTVDVYPTHDHGFVRKIRNRPDNQSPWLADTQPVRRNSFSAESTYRTPRGPYYGDKPIQPSSRLANGKSRPRSTSTTRRVRRDSTPNPLRKSTTSFSSTPPVWRPGGSIKRPKFIGSNAPPSSAKPRAKEPVWNPTGSATKSQKFRAFDPGTKPVPSKTDEPVWRPTSKSISEKPPKYFEPAIKPELAAAMKKEKETPLQRKTSATRVKLSNANPELKTRIANAQSRVKSSWDGTTAAAKEPKPPIPRTTKAAPKNATLPKEKVKPAASKSTVSKPVVSGKKPISPPPLATDTGRSSLMAGPTKPMFQSTPKDQSVAHGDFDDLFENESQILETPKKSEAPRSPIEQTPPKPSTKFESESGTRVPQVMKDDASVQEGDADSTRSDKQIASPHSDIVNNEDEDDGLSNHRLQPSSTPPQRKEPPPKPNNKDDISIVEDEDITEPHESSRNDENSEHSRVPDRSLDNEDEAATHGSKKDNIASSAKSPPAPSQANSGTIAGQKEHSSAPLSESVDEKSDQPSEGGTKNEHDLSNSAAPLPAADDADDFFN